jgi:hypothetical protein
MSSNITLDRYQSAYRSMIIGTERKAFALHAIAYAISNSVLIAFNLLFFPQFIWFLFPLVGWGAGLMIHFYLGISTAPRRIRRDEVRAENRARRGLGTSLA